MQIWKSKMVFLGTWRSVIVRYSIECLPVQEKKKNGNATLYGLLVATYPPCREDTLGTSGETSLCRSNKISYYVILALVEQGRRHL